MEKSGVIWFEKTDRLPFVCHLGKFRPVLFFPATFRPVSPGNGECASRRMVFGSFQLPGQVRKILEGTLGFLLCQFPGLLGLFRCRGVFRLENLFHVVKKILTGHRFCPGFFRRGMEPPVVADNQKLVLAACSRPVVQKAFLNLIIRFAIRREADMDSGLVARFGGIQETCGNPAGPGVFGIKHHKDSFGLPGQGCQMNDKGFPRFGQGFVVKKG